jgi:8-amino-7-oxononanoate synthase
MQGVAEELSALEAAGLRRSLRVIQADQPPWITLEGERLLNFSSNDYLGLAGSDELRAAMLQGVERYGVGSGSARLVCGTSPAHEELEAVLAEFKSTEAALSFSSGFAVPMGVIPALMGKDDVILLDKLSHACLVDAAKLSGATLRVFPHNHLEKLERLLASSQGRRTLIVTESIFSMDGDTAPLREIVQLKERYGAWLLVDEAHGVGLRGPQGRGLVAEQELEGRVELQMGTLSKALGVSGGYIAASRQLIDLLINRARSFIYSTAPPPAIAHAAAAAVELVRGVEGEQRRRLLRRNLAAFGRTDFSAIVPVILGAEAAALSVSQQLRKAGFLVPAIRYPTVAKGSARLRITLSALHEPEHIAALQAAMALCDDGLLSAEEIADTETSED